MGKRVILVADGPGLLVNRCGRPYGAEALPPLQEGVAGHPKACASGAGAAGYELREGSPAELVVHAGLEPGAHPAGRSAGAGAVRAKQPSAKAWATRRTSTPG